MLTALSFSSALYLLLLFSPQEMKGFWNTKSFFSLVQQLPLMFSLFFLSFADGEEKKCKLYLKFDEQCFFGHSFLLWIHKHQGSNWQQFLDTLCDK